MRLPERIKVTATTDSAPLADVLISISIVTTFKNDFILLFGPTDDHGELVITRADLIEGAGREQEMSPMDYGDPETHFAGDLVISIFGGEKVKRAIEVYPLFKDAVQFPRDYLNQLQHAQEILEGLAGREISLDVSVEEGADVLVRTETEY